MSSAAAPPQVWPPPYTVRVSARASRIRLRVLPGTGLEVVLPYGVEQSVAASLVERHRVWIERALKRLRPETESGAAAGADGRNGRAAPALPATLALHGGALVLPICCAEEPAEPASVILRARRDDAAAALRQLRQWTRDYAARYLAEGMAELAGKYGFRYAGARYGRQKSRWGSCTPRGSISLNICLVFLPHELARHVLLHELAHTRHCDHGQGFWKTLFAAEPDALALDKRLRRAWRYVPDWIW